MIIFLARGSRVGGTRLYHNPGRTFYCTPTKRIGELALVVCKEGKKSGSIPDYPSLEQ